MNADLVAPCGMNCGVCYAYLREKNNCPGCRLLRKNIPVSIARCKIRSCKIIKTSKANFCFECSQFPCASIKHLDKRYRTKYSMSMICNLNSIKEKGMKTFLKNEEKRWVKGNKVFCVHKKKYFELKSRC